MTPHEDVRILTRRQQRDPHLEPLADEQFARPGRRALSGGVGIEAEHRVRRKPSQHLRLR